MSESDRRNEKAAEEPAFKVNDRRGEGRDGSSSKAAASTSADAANASVAGSAASAQATAGDHEPPPVDFSTFILSFASTALIQLGAAPHPDSGRIEAAPELARETIDLLGMLREKTRGNLTDEETKLFDALLYDLRMKYVEATGRTS